MKSLLFKLSSALLLLLIYIPVFFMAGSVFANNEIYITQVGTSDNLTIDITQDGDDNVVNFSVSHDDNTVTIEQEGEDAYVGYTTAWGTQSNGDLDGSDNNINIKQYFFFFVMLDWQCCNYVCCRG